MSYRRVFLSIMSILLSLAVMATPASAQAIRPGFSSAGTDTPSLPTVDAANELTFSQLGKGEQYLQGPYDSLGMVFSLPSSWELTSGATLDLLFSTSFNSLNASGTSPSQVNGGSVTITFNGVTISHLQITQIGDLYEQIAIPDSALQPRRLDGRYEINLSLDSGLTCDVNQQLTMIIKPESRFILPHQEITPATDLSKFPEPFSMDPAWPDSAMIVLPDQPTAMELQSAMTIGAGMSNLTGSVTFSLTTESKLSEAERASNHLIMVGKAASLPSLAKLSLVAPVSGSGFNLPSSSPSDGIIQMIASPWNGAKVVLVVSGATDEAVLKASQAISTGTIIPAEQPNLAVVENVAVQPVPQTIPVDQTLANLGYDLKSTTDRLNRPGTTSSIFLFYVPPGNIAGNDAYFKLQFSHSALLNFNRSGLVVLLNNQPIGSFRFSADSAKSSSTAQFQIPAPALLPGNNKIEVRSDLVPVDNCTSPKLAGLWLAISPESTLHLPLNPLTIGSASFFDLSLLPLPFILNPTLDSTAFVVAKNDLTSWNTALKIASDLGNRLNGKLITIKTYFQDAVPDDVKANDHLILFGRPSTLTMLADMKESLPASFEAGSDVAVVKNPQVSYRLGASTPVGYLELLRSPWNKDRVVLAVLGNSVQGISQASDAILVPAQRSHLMGDFSLITDTQIISVDTRLGVSQAANTTSTTPGPTTEQPLKIENFPNAQPGWILPVLLAAIVLMLLTVVIVIISAKRKN